MNSKIVKVENQLAKATGMLVGIKNEQQRHIEFLNELIDLLTQERDRLQNSVSDTEKFLDETTED